MIKNFTIGFFIGQYCVHTNTSFLLGAIMAVGIIFAADLIEAWY